MLRFLPSGFCRNGFCPSDPVEEGTARINYPAIAEDMALLREWPRNVTVEDIYALLKNVPVGPAQLGFRLSFLCLLHSRAVRHIAEDKSLLYFLSGRVGTLYLNP